MHGFYITDYMETDRTVCVVGERALIPFPRVEVAIGVRFERVPMAHLLVIAPVTAVQLLRRMDLHHVLGHLVEHVPVVGKQTPNGGGGETASVNDGNDRDNGLCRMWHRGGVAQGRHGDATIGGSSRAYGCVSR